MAQFLWWFIKGYRSNDSCTSNVYHTITCVMKKSILNRLNILLGATIVGLTGTLTGCVIAPTYGIPPLPPEPNDTIRVLYGVPSTNWQAEESAIGQNEEPQPEDTPISTAE